MNPSWRRQQVPIKLQLGDKTLLASKLWLQVREVGLDDETPPVSRPEPPADSLQADSEGFLIRSLRIAGSQPVFRRHHDFLCYVPSQYPRYYVDMSMSLSEYRSKFSSKTRSTINRKVRKYAEHCGGDISWKVYKNPGEMPEFFRLARVVSKTTYQERLLDAGIPATEEFQREMEQLAQRGLVRGFILFYHGQPVSYLYCPVENGVLIYAYLGYDPNHMNFSVGTILQWFALESLFEERRWRYFDFTEGQSEHKKLFATHNIQCANVFFLRRNVRNSILVHSQKMVDRFSHSVGERLDQFGVKAAARKLMRFGQ